MAIKTAKKTTTKSVAKETAVKPATNKDREKALASDAEVAEKFNK